MVGWGPPWEDQSRLLSETHADQSVTHFCQCIWKDADFHQGQRSERSLYLVMKVSSQRGPGWPEFLCRLQSGLRGITQLAGFATGIVGLGGII